MERISRLGLALSAIIVLCAFVGGGIASFSEEAEASYFEIEYMTYTVITEASGDTPGTVKVKMSYFRAPQPDSTLTIPSEVTNSANGNKYIVTEIDEYGFIELDGLYSKVVLPDTLVKIRQYAFSGRSASTDDDGIDGTSIKSIEFNNGLEEICSNAFDGCRNLTTVDIPTSVTSLGQNVFRNCTSLNTVNLREGITFIGKGTFDGCEKLTTLFVPDSLTDSFSEIPWNAFHSNSFLEEIIINNSNTNYTSIDGIVYTKDKTTLVYCPPAKTSANVEDGVKNIGMKRGQIQSISQGFYGCKKLVNVSLPNSLERIEEQAFYMCQELEGVQIPDSVTYIGPDAFYTCESLADIAFPAKLNSIGDGAFIQCSLLNNIHLPYGLETIGEYAFERCTSLERIEIPDTVTTIGKGTFRDCIKLQGVDLPDGIKTIESEMFFNCKSLRTFVVPDDVTSIGNIAFSGCWGLVSIEFPTTITSMNRGAFGDGSHKFFNKNYTDDSDCYKPGGSDIGKIQGRTYIGSVYLSEFTFHEYAGTETDARYNIRYYTNGGYNDFANPPDMTREDEIELAEPTREGHTFDGWYTDPGFTDKITTIKNQSENIRLYASWTPDGVQKHKVTIKFEGPNGEILNTEEHYANEGTDYSFTLASPREGYDPEKNLVSGKMGTEDVEIVVKLIPKTFKITLVTNQSIATIEGWTSAGDTKFTSSIAFGSKIELPSLSYGGRDCRWPSSCPETMPANDLEFTAEWQYILTLNFGDRLKNESIDLSGEGWKKTNGVFTKGLFHGDAISLPDVRIDGYTVSWPANALATMPDRDYSVDAVVTVNSYPITISFKSDAPSSIAGWELLKDGAFQKSFDYGSRVELPELGDAARTVVWNADVPTTMPSRHLEFIGEWKTATYRIDITIGTAYPDSIPGWDHNGRGVYSKELEYGSEIDLPEGLVPGFASWNRPVPPTMPAEPLSFTAVQKASYRIALPSGTGYTIETVTGYNASVIWEGDDFKFKIVLKPAYNKSTPVVKVGDTVLEPVDGIYTITDIGSDLTVSVSGIEANPTPGGSGEGPSTPSKPDVKIDEDGTKTTTEKNSDGSVTETVEKPDGTTTVTKTEKDGSKTETTTNADGSSVTKKTDADGSYEETSTGSDGSKKESSMTKTDTGTIETEKTFDSEGNETGSIEKTTETIENDSGKMTSETVKTKDSDGKEAVKKKLESSDGSLSISIDASMDGGKVSLKTEIKIDVAPGSDISDTVSKALDLIASEIKKDVTEGDADASHTMKISTDGDKTRISADSLARISDLGMKASFDLGAGSVEFDSDASKKLSESRSLIDISMTRADLGGLSDAKKAAVGDRLALEISAGSDDGYIHDLGGIAKISLSYELPVGVSASDVRAFYVDDDGVRHMMDTIFDALSGKLSFTTPHFSLYVIGTVADAEVPSEEEESGSSMWIYVAIGVIVAIVAVAAVAIHRKG